MKAIIAIARAEVLKNWKLVAVPLLAVFGVFALAALGTRVTDRDFRGNLMSFLTIFGIPLAGVPAAVLGLNLFGPDIRQRRLSFFLTRPCSPLQLWLGRLLGAAFVVAVGWLAVMLTNPLAGPAGLSATGALMIAVFLGALFFVVNAISMVLAANASSWFIADVVIGLSIVAGVFWSFGRALSMGGPQLVGSGALFVALTFLGGLFLAGFAYLAVGHGDGPAGHRAHSLALWTLGALTLTGLAVQRGYEWSRPIGSLLSYTNASSLDSETAIVGVWGKHSTASFLVKPGTGEIRRVSGFAGFGTLRNTRSGIAAFVEERLDPLNARDGLTSNHLVVTTFDADQPPIAERYLPERLRRILDISADGKRALFSTWNGLVLMSTTTGDELFDHKLAQVKWASFLGTSRILVLGSDGSFAMLNTITLEGKVETERRFPITGPNWTMQIHEPSGRVAISELIQGATVYERDGKVIANISAYAQRDADRASPASRPSLAPVALRFTRSGDLVFAHREGLRVVRHGETEARDLRPMREGAPVPLERPRISGVLDTGEMVIWQNNLKESSVLFVAPGTGEVRTLMPGLRPLTFGWGHRLVDADGPNDGIAIRLFENEDGDILYADPATPTPRVLVKNTAGAGR